MLITQGMLLICKKKPELEKERSLLFIEERAAPFPSVGLTGEEWNRLELRASTADFLNTVYLLIKLQQTKHILYQYTDSVQ